MCSLHFLLSYYYLIIQQQQHLACTLQAIQNAWKEESPCLKNKSSNHFEAY